MKIKFEFYHGTSDIFLKSIKENGLGGINPNFENKHLSTLKFLYELAEKYLVQDNTYLKIRDTTKAMSFQSKLQFKYQDRLQTLNFKHDGIYIVLSEQRAISYASNNKYGSEIVCRAINLMDLLDKKNVDYSNPDLAIENFRTIRKSNPKPIIIKIKDVDENKLDKEDCKTAKEALSFLRNIQHLLNEKEKFEFYQFCNFKILAPIPIDKLEFYELYFDGKFGDPDFKYSMRQIK